MLNYLFLNSFLRKTYQVQAQVYRCKSPLGRNIALGLYSIVSHCT